MGQKILSLITSTIEKFIGAINSLIDQAVGLIGKPFMLLGIILVTVAVFQIVFGGKSEVIAAIIGIVSSIAATIKSGGWQFIIAILLVGVFFGKK